METYCSVAVKLLVFKWFGLLLCFDSFKLRWSLKENHFNMRHHLPYPRMGLFFLCTVTHGAIP